MNSHAQKVLDAYPVRVETFMVFDLLPKFEMLSGDEKDKLLMNEQRGGDESKERRRSRKRVEREEQKRQNEVEMIHKRYYSARQFLVEMLTDGGYVVPDMEAELSLDDFHVAFGDHPKASRLSITAHRASDHSRKVCLYECVTVCCLFFESLVFLFDMCCLYCFFFFFSFLFQYYFILK